MWRVCSSPFRGGMFFKSVSHGRLSSSAYSWLNSYNTEDRARETIFQTTTPQGKPCSILSKLQCCVSHEVRSILYIYSQASLRSVNIFSSNSLSLVKLLHFVNIKDHVKWLFFVQRRGKGGAKGRLSRYVEIFWNKKGFSVLYKTNRFHVALRQFSNRSQMTSKCGKNKKVAHEA